MRNYFPVINYAVKELSHGLSSPTEADFERLKRFGRYLVGAKFKSMFFPREGSPKIQFVDTDSDWAGCKVDRKSTSSHMIHCGGCLLADNATTQSVIGQSSGEAETYAAAKEVSAAILVS